MAATETHMCERVSGYQCQFISEVSDDLLCGICRLVARESHSTNCCGGHFCKNCITEVLDASKPCPSCNEVEFAVYPDKRDQKKILALQVCCTMKDRGCEWVGKLEDLQAHLLVDTNDCQYVDIQCPDKCGESVPRNQLPSHLADSCLNRDYFCKYCNLKSTYHTICNEHLSECLRYPVQCPNACSVGAVERENLEDHIKTCLLQKMSCELSHAGCKETFLHEDENRHMEENTQKHLLLMSAMSQRMYREFEQKLQEQREEKERERKHTQQTLEESERRITQAREEFEKQISLAKGEFEQKLQEQREEKEREIAEMKKELCKKDDQIQALEEKREQEMKALRENNDRAMKTLKEEKDKQMKEMQVMKNLAYQLQVQGIVQGIVELQHVPNRCTPPVCFIMNNFNKLKTTNSEWTSPDLYTHEGGYKIYFTVNPNGIYVYPFTKPGEFDDQLKWPVEATFTLQLLNQHRDQDHITRTWESHWSWPTKPICITTWYIPHADLEWNDRKQTQYLKNDCLVFQLTKAEERIIEL